MSRVLNWLVTISHMKLANSIFINWTKGNDGSCSVLILQSFNTCKLFLGPEIYHLQKYEERHQSSQKCSYHLT